MDIPDSVLAQLGNRVQHALRAFTPRDQKAVKATAQTMRPNPDVDIEAAITELAVGEALISFLDEKGRPGITQRVYVVPLAVTLVQLKTPSVSICWPARWWLASMRKPWTVNLPMKCCWLALHRRPQLLEASPTRQQPPRLTMG